MTRERKSAKYEATMKVKARVDPSGLDSLLEFIFYKKVKEGTTMLADSYHARRFLEMIKSRGKDGLPVGKHIRMEVCKELGFQDGDKPLLGPYYSIIKKLRGVGMIEKREAKWHLSNRFPSRLRRYEEVWNAWRLE